MSSSRGPRAALRIEAAAPVPALARVRGPIDEERAWEQHGRRSHARTPARVCSPASRPSSLLLRRARQRESSTPSPAPRRAVCAPGSPRPPAPMARSAGRSGSPTTPKPRPRPRRRCSTACSCRTAPRGAAASRPGRSRRPPARPRRPAVRCRAARRPRARRPRRPRRRRMGRRRRGPSPQPTPRALTRRPCTPSAAADLGLAIGDLVTARRRRATATAGRRHLDARRPERSGMVRRADHRVGHDRGRCRSVRRRRGRDDGCPCRDRRALDRPARHRRAHARPRRDAARDPPERRARPARPARASASSGLGATRRPRRHARPACSRASAPCARSLRSPCSCWRSRASPPSPGSRRSSAPPDASRDRRCSARAAPRPRGSRARPPLEVLVVGAARRARSACRRRGGAGARPPRRGRATGASPWLAASVALVAAVVDRRRAAPSSTRGARVVRGSGDEVGRAPRTAVAGGALLIAVAAAIALWQFRLYGSPLVTSASGSVDVDPVAVLAPVLVLLALSLLALGADRADRRACSNGSRPRAPHSCPRCRCASSPGAPRSTRRRRSSRCSPSPASPSPRRSPARGRRSTVRCRRSPPAATCGVAFAGRDLVRGADPLALADPFADVDGITADAPVFRGEVRIGSDPATLVAAPVGAARAGGARNGADATARPARGIGGGGGNRASRVGVDARGRRHRAGPGGHARGAWRVSAWLLTPGGAATRLPAGEVDIAAGGGQG